MNKLKNLCLTALVFLIGTFIAIVISELFCRLFPNVTGVYATANDSVPSIYVQDEKRGYGLLPESIGRHRSLYGDFDVVYHINSQGLRSLRKSYSRKACKRILLLGDSFIFGIGTRDDETLAARLEQILNKNSAEAEFEIINTGVPGYALDNEYMTLKEFMHLEPDMVLLGLCVNDILDLAFHRWITDDAGDMVKVIETARHIDNHNRFVNGPKELYSNSNYSDRLKEFCRRHLVLYNLLGTFRYRNRASGEIRVEHFSRDKNKQTESLKKSLMILSSIKRLCVENGAKIAIFSVDRGMLTEYPEINTTNLDIPVFDISELYSRNKKLTHVRDGHWSPDGTVDVANWLVDSLQEEIKEITEP